MTKPNRKFVLVTIQRVRCDELEGDFQEVRKFLLASERKAKKDGFRNVKLTFHQQYDEPWFEVWGERLETDKEYDRRVKRQQAAKKRQIRISSKKPING
jgi:hypothetical protein